MSFMATLHCISGCVVAEIVGLIISTALGGGEPRVDRSRRGSRVRLRVRADLELAAPRGADHGSCDPHIALATDTVSITTTEIIDNLFVLIVPAGD